MMLIILIKQMLVILCIMIMMMNIRIIHSFTLPSSSSSCSKIDSNSNNFKNNYQLQDNNYHHKSKRSLLPLYYHHHQQNNYHHHQYHRVTPLYDNNKSQQNEFQINSQIARLNAVAAKLRAEAAELEAEQKKMMADGLAVAFKSFDTDNDGVISVQELKEGLANALEASINEEQALKIMKVFDVNGDGAMQFEEFRGVDALRKRLDEVLKEERTVAIEAQNEARVAKLEALKLERIAEMINNRPPTVTDRILGGFPYLLPLLDVFPYGRNLFETYNLQNNAIVALFVLLFNIYRAIPFVGLFAFFSLSLLTNNLRLNRLIRYNVQQSILIDVLLIIPGVTSAIFEILSKQFGSIQSTGLIQDLSTWGNNFVFLSVLGLFIYGVVMSWFGFEADNIPYISNIVKQRVPTTEEFQSFLNEKNDLFDEDKENKK